MGPDLWIRRLPTALVGLALAVAVLFGGASARAAGLSISISGNHFVNGAGQTVRLLGVNRPSFEYACDQGWDYSDDLMTSSGATAIAAWNATAVRVPLNEDCWLGINGDPSSAQQPPEGTLTVSGYRTAVQNYVAALNQAGLYAILDLHWSAPGTNKASNQQPMADADHSVDFWSSVAQTFAANPAVVFDAYNEPYSQHDGRSSDGSGPPLSWSCWRNGGCSVDMVDADGNRTATAYPVAGMQSLVTAIRNAGANQPILLGGLNFSNDLVGTAPGDGWLANEPTDPEHQLAASLHSYSGQACSTVDCWNAQVAPVAAQVPVVIGEFGQDTPDASCQQPGSQTYDNDLMTWADQHGVSYLAWAWTVLSSDELTQAGCDAYMLISDASGTPFAPNGTAVHDHLATLPAGGITPGTGTGGGGGGGTGGAAGTGGGGTKSTGTTAKPGLQKFTATLTPKGTGFRFVVRSSQKCTGTVGVQTISTFAIAHGHVAHKPRRVHVTLASTRFSLAAGQTRTLTVGLSRSGRTLLAHHRSLKVRVTITLVNAAKRRSVTKRATTLHRAAAHH